MNKWNTVIELKTFQSAAADLLKHKEHQALIEHLAKFPEDGNVIPGTGGLRKLRWVRPGMGKRGGLRIIYYFYNHSAPLYLITVYSKNQNDDLTSNQKSKLSKLVEQLKIECLNHRGSHDET